MATRVFPDPTLIPLNKEPESRSFSAGNTSHPVPPCGSFSVRPLPSVSSISTVPEKADNKISSTELKNIKKKCHAILFFKVLHKFHLMRMNICQRKRLGAAFLCIKADRNSLYCTYIVNSTSLVKVCQSNVTVLFVHAYRSDGSGNLLYQSKSLPPCTARLFGLQGPPG